MDACMILIVGRHVPYALWSEFSNISLLFRQKFPSIPQIFPCIFHALHHVFLFTNDYNNSGREMEPCCNPYLSQHKWWDHVDSWQVQIQWSFSSWCRLTDIVTKGRTVICIIDQTWPVSFHSNINLLCCSLWPRIILTLLFWYHLTSQVNIYHCGSNSNDQNSLFQLKQGATGSFHLHRQHILQLLNVEISADVCSLRCRWGILWRIFQHTLCW